MSDENRAAPYVQRVATAIEQKGITSAPLREALRAPAPQPVVTPAQPAPAPAPASK
jgi:hypothetical protein